MEQFESDSWIEVGQTQYSEFQITQGLVTGQTYTYRVIAQNEVGRGTASISKDVIAARVPDAPDFELIALLESSLSTIRFSWAEPYDGGSPVTHSQIWWDRGDRNEVFTAYAFTVDPDTEFLVEDGLTAGVFYAFKIASVNAVGISELSEAVTFVAASLPGAPGIPSLLTRSEVEITIQWPTGDENGSTVYKYQVFEAPNTETTFTYVGESMSLLFTSTDLVPGNNYRYKVKAVNYAGIGPFSLESDFIIAAVVPDAPVAPVKLYADNEFITISWSEPLYNGGSPVYGYKVEWDAGTGACCS